MTRCLPARVIKYIDRIKMYKLTINEVLLAYGFIQYEYYIKNIAIIMFTIIALF